MHLLLRTACLLAGLQILLGCSSSIANESSLEVVFEAGYYAAFFAAAKPAAYRGEVGALFLLNGVPRGSDSIIVTDWIRRPSLQTATNGHADHLAWQVRQIVLPSAVTRRKVGRKTPSAPGTPCGSWQDAHSTSKPPPES